MEMTCRLAFTLAGAVAPPLPGALPSECLPFYLPRPGEVDVGRLCRLDVACGTNIEAKEAVRSWWELIWKVLLTPTPTALLTPTPTALLTPTSAAL